MTRNPRTPGRIDEPTVGISADAIDPDALQTRSPDHQPRQPGLISEPTEAMASDPEMYSEIGNSKKEPAYYLHGVSDPRQKSIGWRWVALALAVLLIVWIALSWIQGLTSLYIENAFLGVSLAIISLAAVVVFTMVIAREVRAFALIDRISDRAIHLSSAVSSGRVDKVEVVLKETIENIRQNEPKLVLQFEKASSSATTPEDFLRQLDNIVLLELDKKADALIKQMAMSTGVAVAITPHPAFDALVVLVQSIRLTRRLGDIYGLAPTGLSAAKLFIYTFNSAILASATHLATDTLIEAFGSDFVKVVGKYATEAGVTGYRVYRLGRMVRSTCRPIGSPQKLE